MWIDEYREKSEDVSRTLELLREAGMFDLAYELRMGEITARRALVNSQAVFPRPSFYQAERLRKTLNRLLSKYAKPEKPSFQLEPLRVPFGQIPGLVEELGVQLDRLL